MQKLSCVRQEKRRCVLYKFLEGVEREMVDILSPLRQCIQHWLAPLVSKGGQVMEHFPGPDSLIRIFVGLKLKKDY